jgi:hypothetical protein
MSNEPREAKCACGAAVVYDDNGDLLCGDCYNQKHDNEDDDHASCRAALARVEGERDAAIEGRENATKNAAILMENAAWRAQRIATLEGALRSVQQQIRKLAFRLPSHRFNDFIDPIMLEIESALSERREGGR